MNGRARAASHRRMRLHTMLATSALVLAGCTTPPAPPRPTAAAASGAVPEGGTAGQAVTRAVTAPLSDLNLMRAQIPPALLAARQAPYALPPADAGCGELAREVQALDEALGPDLDRPADDDDPGLLERGTQELGGAAVGALKSAAEGLVPLRSWVRRLSGAERHAREVGAAIAAGAVRRAFLKGLGQAGRCAPPAAPLHPAQPRS